MERRLRARGVRRSSADIRKFGHAILLLAAQAEKSAETEHKRLQVKERDSSKRHPKGRDA
jgi:hypothetical protein